MASAYGLVTKKEPQTNVHGSLSLQRLSQITDANRKASSDGSIHESPSLRRSNTHPVRSAGHAVPAPGNRPARRTIVGAFRAPHRGGPGLLLMRSYALWKYLLVQCIYRTSVITCHPSAQLLLQSVQPDPFLIRETEIFLVFSFAQRIMDREIRFVCSSPRTFRKQEFGQKLSGTSVSNQDGSSSPSRNNLTFHRY